MTQKVILLAEDDVDDRELFIEVVKARTDIRLLPVAKNGEEVIEILNESGTPPPDIILLDQNMPKRNGLNTLQYLKEDGNYKNIPVFIYSTYADESLTKRSIDAGAASVFIKPFSHEGYNNMIDELLEFVK